MRLKPRLKVHKKFKLKFEAKARVLVLRLTLQVLLGFLVFPRFPIIIFRIFKYCSNFLKPLWASEGSSEFLGFMIFLSVVDINGVNYILVCSLYFGLLLMS